MNFLFQHCARFDRLALHAVRRTCRNGQGKRPHTVSTQKSGACLAHCGEYTMCFRQHERHNPHCKRLGWAGVRFLRTRSMRTPAHPNLLPTHSVERNA